MGKRVLVITYYFPPCPEVASLRLKGLAKYLPEYGWELVILTAKLPGKPETRFKVIETPYPGDVPTRWKRKLGLAENKAFLKQIGLHMVLHEDRTSLRMVNAIRAVIASLTNRMVNVIREVVAYPDPQKDWYPFALRVGHELLRRERFDALLSSSGPVTCHLIAKKLKAQHGLPWIADLRDLWTQNHYYSYGSLRLMFERKLEIKTLSFADALVTVSKPWAKKLQSLHPRNPVFVILNGYDSDEMTSVTPTKEFTITYTGQFYYQGGRNPSPLFQALADLISEGKINRCDVKVRFYGPVEYWLEQAVKLYQLEDIVILHPFVPREEATVKQRESQILLLLKHTVEADAYPAKVFEYLAAQRPILSMGGPKGVVGELLEETGAGLHVSSYEELKNVLVQFYDKYKVYGQVPYNGKKESIVKYSHYEMAHKFADILDFVVGKN